MIRKITFFEIGSKAGDWTIIGPPQSTKNGRSFPCACACGVYRLVLGRLLRDGISKSCGCRQLTNPTNLIHGMSNSPEYNVWSAMIYRCENPNCPAYENYGGRGITVCSEWRNEFSAFYAHIGPRPSAKYSLDRWPNKDGNYEPGNVRWATQIQQCNNLRTNKILTANGETHTLAEWARIKNIDPSAISRRLKMGWDEQRAVNEPSNKSAGRFISTKMLTFQGETLSMNDWARRNGFPLHLVKQRISSGWPVETAITTPIQEQFSHKSVPAPQEDVW